MKNEESSFTHKDIIAINKFLFNNKILIVDRKKSIRGALHGAISNTFDVKNINILDARDKFEAFEKIKEVEPIVIISNYELEGKESGIELFVKYREDFKSGKNCVCILLVSDDSQSMIAKAAEEEVDGFLVLPLNIKTIINILKSSIEIKVETKKYMDLINSGKDLFDVGKYIEGMTLFKDAIKLKKKYSMGYFYLGQCLERLNDTKDATKMYQRALNYNSMHLKSLIALYEVHFKNKEYLQAYDIIKKINKNFPTDPQRLGKVIHLAIQTENYNDIELFYDIFKNLENRDQISTRYISAGLLIATQWFFQNEKVEHALEVLAKIKTSFSVHSDLLEKAIEILVEHNYMEEANEYYLCFSANENDSKSFKIASFLVNKDKLKDPELVHEGMELINQMDVKNYMVHNIIYHSHLNLGNESAAQKIMEEMKILFPEKYP